MSEKGRIRVHEMVEIWRRLPDPPRTFTVNDIPRRTKRLNPLIVKMKVRGLIAPVRDDGQRKIWVKRVDQFSAIAPRIFARSKLPSGTS